RTGAELHRRHYWTRIGARFFALDSLAVVWSYATGSAYLCGSGGADRLGGYGCELFSGTAGRLNGPDGDVPQRIEPQSERLPTPGRRSMQILHRFAGSGPQTHGGLSLPP